MEYTGDFLELYAGLPLVLSNGNIAITQPTIKDIAAFGEKDVFNGVSFFVNFGDIVAPLKRGNSQLENLPNFQILLTVLEEKTDLWELVVHFLSFICPNYQFELFPAGINFLDPEDKDMILGQLNVNNIDDFIQKLKIIFLPKGQMGDIEEEDFHPANDKAAEIAEKLKAGRRKVAEINQAQRKTTSILMNYVSILVVGLSMDISTVLNMTPFQLYDTHMRLFAKQESDFYTHLCTVPFMDTSKLEAPNPWTNDLYI